VGYEEEEVIVSTKPYAHVANRLARALELESPAVALAFVDQSPPDVAELSSETPSACSLWRRAEGEVFYAPAAKHFNCAVGAMTMGFALDERAQARLGDVVGQMCACGYVGADEPARIPKVGRPAAGIVYGPLGDLPVEPDLVLVWLRPHQAMLFNEASGAASWAGLRHLPVLGRPACAALPHALAASEPALSLGCLGMRTFTEVSGDRMLAVIPRANLEAFVDALETTVAANRTMRAAYDAQKAAFTAQV
jgi:uncharacterized protein (DUF169 family)